uniref:Pirin-like protein n=1 Tax=Arundo donax TaxID=35708 RepID=A0A0A8ZS87_ARUDO
MMYTKAFQPSGMGWCSWDPGCMVKSMYMVGVRVYTGDRTPKASPAMILTSTPSFSTRLMSLLWSSWYRGSIILSFEETLIQSCRPFCTPSPAGISECTMPRPAVIHWTSPALMVPLWPAKSWWVKAPSSM